MKSVSDIRSGLPISQHMMKTFGDLIPKTKSHGDPRFLRLITGEPHPLGNFVFVSDSDDHGAVETGLKELDGVQEPKAVLFLTETNETTNALLGDRGFQGPSRMPVMAVDIERLCETPVPVGYEFVEIHPSDEVGWVQTVVDGYPIPHGLASVFAPSNCAEHGGSALKFYGVRKGSEMVAVSMLYCVDGLAGIYTVATLPEERGKGLGALVTAEPLRRAAREGYTVGVLQSSDMGFPVYRRLGFEELGGMSMFLKV